MTGGSIFDPRSLRFSLDTVVRPRADEKADIGSALLELGMRLPAWIQRRSEHWTFPDHRTLRVSVRLDLDLAVADALVGGLPEWKGHFLLPVAAMSRRHRSSITMRDGNGGLLPRITKQDERSFLAAELFRQALIILGRQRLDEETASQLSKVVFAAPSEEFPDYTRSRDLQELQRNSEFIDSTDYLRDNWLLIAPLILDGPELRVVSFDYLSSFPRSRVVSLSSDDREPLVRAEVPGALHANSFHLDVEAPPELRFHDAHAVLRLKNTGGSGSDNDRRVLDDDTLDGQAHIYLSRPEDVSSRTREVEFRANLREHTHGVLMGALAASIMTAVTIWIVALNLPIGLVDFESEAATTLVLLFPSLAAALLMSPPSHPFTRRVLLQVRLMTALSFAGATIFALPLVISDPALVGPGAAGGAACAMISCIFLARRTVKALEARRAPAAA